MFQVIRYMGIVEAKVKLNRFRYFYHYFIVIRNSIYINNKKCIVNLIEV